MIEVTDFIQLERFKYERWQLNRTQNEKVLIGHCIIHNTFFAAESVNGEDEEPCWECFNECTEIK